MVQEKSFSTERTPKEKDPKQLDLFGKKLYLLPTVHLRVANFQAMLVKYGFLT